MDKKVLITGVSGFIGSSLEARLTKEYKVIGQSKTKVNSVNDTSLFVVDINSQTNWDNVLIGVDTIVHLAGVAHNKSRDMAYIYEVNFKGTINLALQAAESNVKRLIFISSIGVLGSVTNEPFNEESVTNPNSEYANSKLRAENELLKIAESTSLEVVIIRPPLVYGVGAIGNFAKLVDLIGKLPVLPFGLCDNKKSFISVDNLTDFISVCISHPKAKNQIFCLSDGVDVSVKEFTSEIALALRKNVMQIPVPIFVFQFIGSIFGKKKEVHHLIDNLQIDSTKAKVLLSWEPVSSMPETLKLLINE